MRRFAGNACLWLMAVLFVFGSSATASASDRFYIGLEAGFSKLGDLDVSQSGVNNVTRCDSLLYPSGTAPADCGPGKVSTVVSSLKRNRWISSEEYLIRGFEAKASSRSVVQFVHNSVSIFLAEPGEVHSLWKVLSYKAVCVFTRSPFPGVVRTGEVPVVTGDLVLPDLRFSFATKFAEIGILC